MLEIFRTIDRLLRGELTLRRDLRRGQVQAPGRILAAAGALLGIIYGIFMGLYGVLRPGDPQVWQLAATAVKVPLLFLLTLVITLPSLYVFSTLAGSRLRFPDTCRVLLAGITINLALLASFGPVTGFFTLCTDSYPFMVVLNTGIFAVGGLAGLVFMSRILDSVFEPEAAFESDFPLEAGEPRTGRPAPGPAISGLFPGRARRVFYVWMAVYGAVGAQMGWVLRPFIGAPGMGFTFFRERQSNFYEAILKAIRHFSQ